MKLVKDVRGVGEFGIAAGNLRFYQPSIVGMSNFSSRWARLVKQSSWAALILKNVQKSLNASL